MAADSGTGRKRRANRPFLLWGLRNLMPGLPENGRKRSDDPGTCVKAQNRFFKLSCSASDNSSSWAMSLALAAEYSPSSWR